MTGINRTEKEGKGGEDGSEQRKSMIFINHKPRIRRVKEHEDKQLEEHLEAKGGGDEKNTRKKKKKTKEKKKKKKKKKQKKK